MQHSQINLNSTSLSSSQSSDYIDCYSEKLEAAINQGSVFKVKTLLQLNPNLLHVAMPNKDLPLHYAVRIQKEEIVQALLSSPKAPDVEEIADDQGLTPLAHALLNCDEKMARLLIQTSLSRVTKDSIHIQNLREQLNQAIQGFQSDSTVGCSLLESLEKDPVLCIQKIQQASDIRQLEGLFHKVLEKAFENPKYMLILYALLEKGADPNELNENGKSPLHLAAEKNNRYLLDLLVAYGGDVNKSTKSLIPSNKEETCISLLLSKHPQPKDPLALQSADVWLFLSAIAYGISVGIVYMGSDPFEGYLPAMINTVGAMGAFAFSNAKIEGVAKKVFSVGLYGILENVSPFGQIFKLGRAVEVCERGYEGIQVAYRNLSLDPYRAVRNATIHAVNAYVGFSIGYNSMFPSTKTPEKITEPRPEHEALDKLDTKWTYSGTISSVLKNCLWPVTFCYKFRKNFQI